MSENPLYPSKSDIIIEPKSPGYVQLKMGTYFRKLHRDVKLWETVKVTETWVDNNNYLLRSKFQYWFKGIVNKAFHKFEKNERGYTIVEVNKSIYTLRLSESGPAITLFIERESDNFKCDADLVPAIQFSENRWPISKGYRNIPPGCSCGDWMIVPKANKAAGNIHDENRSWRVALPRQELKLMTDAQMMKQSIRIVSTLYVEENEP